MSAKKVGPKKKSAPRGSARPVRAASEAAAQHRASSNEKEWSLRLYVAGESPRSRTALQNLQRLCEERLKGKYKIEVIDLTKRPELAKADQILAVPTLVRKIPEPMKRIIGDLSDADRALLALEMAATVAEA